VICYFLRELVEVLAGEVFLLNTKKSASSI